MLSSIILRGNRRKYACLAESSSYAFISFRREIVIDHQYVESKPADSLMREKSQCAQREIAHTFRCRTISQELDGVHAMVPLIKVASLKVFRAAISFVSPAAPSRQMEQAYQNINSYSVTHHDGIRTPTGAHNHCQRQKMRRGPANWIGLQLCTDATASAQT